MEISMIERVGRGKGRQLCGGHGLTDPLDYPYSLVWTQSFSLNDE